MPKRIPHEFRVTALLEGFDQIDHHEREALRKLRTDDYDADSYCADYQATYQKLNFGDLP